MYDAFISLGHDCQTAHQLEANKLKGPSLPFDWAVTPFSSVHALIQSDFTAWLQPQNLALVQDNQVGWYVEDKRYRIRFLHDFPLEPNFMQVYGKVRSKYLRRVERLLDLLNSSRRVLFVRVDISPADAYAFDDMLCKKFPRLDYELLALSAVPEAERDWGSPRVSHRFLPQPAPYDWAGLDEPWRNILSGILRVPAESFSRDIPLVARLEPFQKRVSVGRGQTQTLGIRVINESPFPLAWGAEAFGLSYHLFSSSGRLPKWDNERTWFRQVLQSGEARDFEIAIAVPDVPGTYRAEFDLVWEGAFWLKENGSPTSTVEILVHG